LTHLVDASVDADVMAARRLRSRPAPDILFAACDALGLEPRHAVSLTHSGAGVVAAVAAQVPVIAIATGDEAEGLAAYGAATVVASLDSLLDPRLR
jgi:beta-phosphoglucomutase-like phosphatase (HAD superfamily)